LEAEFSNRNEALTDDSVDQMIVLAERLRAANGGNLDDAAIQAVAEATGAPAEYVRLAVKLRTEKQRQSSLSSLRAQFLTLDPDTRRYVTSGTAAAGWALLNAIEARFGSVVQEFSDGQSRTGAYGVFGMLALVALTLGLYTVSVSRDRKVAAIAGAILVGGYYAMNAIFAFILRVPTHIESLLLIPCTLGGALGGIVLHKIVDQYRGKLGLKDPAKERQQLLSQLVALQDKLRSGEQSITFLSVDIVGSTKMKEQSDPLSIEFTFNEYHQFVERVTRKYGGRVHSTAGDGVTCAFENAQQAFSAARNIQMGILEVNTFRNKIGIPIRLRVGLHTGTVLTPTAGDIKSLNYAHVIDIAAHIQKVSPTGGIAVSDATAMYLPGGASSVGSERVEAMNVSATVWLPRVAGSAGGAPSTPPAIP